MKSSLISKIEGKSALIGIIGLGYVGLPLALSFSESGFSVVGLEVDLEKIKKLQAGESTVYPGATEEELTLKLSNAGFRVGEDIFVVFSPEREDPGNAKFHTRNIPKIVGGSTQACKEVGIYLYKQVIDKVIPVATTQTA